MGSLLFKPRGTINRVLYGKAQPRGPTLYPAFHMPILTEKVPPLSYAFYWSLQMVTVLHT